MDKLKDDFTLLYMTGCCMCLDLVVILAQKGSYFSHSCAVARNSTLTYNHGPDCYTDTKWRST